ncbi:MAG: hypothetical protein ABW352_19290 [Polyangiales bacterium]
MARSLLTGCGVVSLGVVVTSVLGLEPLAGRAGSLALLAAGLVAAGASLRGARVHAAAGPRWLATVGGLTLAVGALATAVTVGLALWLPVGAYDAIGYRLPAVAQWLDAGAWSWVAGDDPLRNGYPLGLELIEAALWAGFGSPFAVDAVASVFVVAGAAALFGFAQRLPRGAGALAAGLFLLVPMHLLNAPSGYADAAFAGAMACLVVAVARLERDEAAWSELGVAAAWTMALKPHGIAYAGLALLVAVWRRARTWRDPMKAAAIASTGLVFALRNVVREGNPIYPVEVRIAGRVVLPGRESLDAILTPTFNVPAELTALPSWLRPLWVWLQPYGPARSFDDRFAGFGYAFVLVALPATGWLLLRARGEYARAFFVLLAVSAVCWLVQPMSFWPRFSSWLWAAGAIAIALTVSQLIEAGRSGWALAVCALAVALAVPEAAYALAHVKSLDRLALWNMPPRERLAKLAKIEPAFVERALAGKRDVCRSEWRLGTDDANLDGVVAQLSPRPRMHVIDSTPLSRALADSAARGCDALIVIGDNPLASQPLHLVERLRAFGEVSLVPVTQTEVTP